MVRLGYDKRYRLDYEALGMILILEQADKPCTDFPAATPHSTVNVSLFFRGDGTAGTVEHAFGSTLTLDIDSSGQILDLNNHLWATSDDDDGPSVMKCNSPLHGILLIYHR